MDRPFSFMSRRRFLRIGLISGAALGTAGGGVALWLRPPGGSVDDLTTLSSGEYRTLVNIVEANFGDGSPLGVDISSMDLPRAFDAFLRDEHPANVRDLRRALTVIEAAPIVFDRGTTPFSKLSPEERAAAWASWPSSEHLVVRQVSLAFRKVLNMIFYDREEVWAAIGYPGPSLAARMTAASGEGR